VVSKSIVAHVSKVEAEGIGLSNVGALCHDAFVNGVGVVGVGVVFGLKSMVVVDC
jgi:hypothetical protein